MIPINIFHNEVEQINLFVRFIKLESKKSALQQFHMKECFFQNIFFMNTP
ncbi:hypothetical protein pb186bvf_002419 [Paramecium bursaria]